MASHCPYNYDNFPEITITNENKQIRESLLIYPINWVQDCICSRICQKDCKCTSGNCVTKHLVEKFKNSLKETEKIIAKCMYVPKYISNERHYMYYNECEKVRYVTNYGRVLSYEVVPPLITHHHSGTFSNCVCKEYDTWISPERFDFIRSLNADQFDAVIPLIIELEKQKLIIIKQDTYRKYPSQS
jgi:hypothetical protein